MASSSLESDSENARSTASQPLGQRVASGLVRSLTGGSVTGGDTLGNGTGDQSNLLPRQNTTERNRARVQETRRQVASEMLMASMGCLCGISVLMIGYLIASIYMYFWGWYVFTHNTKEECDVPLKWWLFTMLILPWINCQTQQNQEQNAIILNISKAIMTPICLLIGVYLYTHSTTCKDTNPALYHFVKVYLIWYGVSWILSVVFIGGCVSIIFTLNRMGLLEGGPGPHMAARSDLIDDIQTVTFNPADFCESGSEGKEPPECAICFAQYKEGEQIKKTPCGHFFHEECIGKWLENAKSCPLCRKDLQDAIDNGGRENV